MENDTEIVDPTNFAKILIEGRSTSGKTFSLQYLENQEGVAYINCDNNNIPYKHNFGICASIEIADNIAQFRDNFIEILLTLDEDPKTKVIVIDTLTKLFEIVEVYYVLKANKKEAQRAWGWYNAFGKEVMDTIKSLHTHVICTAHLVDIVNEQTGISEVRAPVKGNLAKIGGLESEFTIITLATVQDKAPEDIDVDDEEDLGTELVFQTRKTRVTKDYRMRAPVGFWEKDELYIPANAQTLLDKFTKYRN